MIIRKAMYGCGLYFFIKLAYNSPILCKFASNLSLNKKYTIFHCRYGYRIKEFNKTKRELFKMV